MKQFESQPRDSSVGRAWDCNGNQLHPGVKSSNLFRENFFASFCLFLSAISHSSGHCLSGSGLYMAGAPCGVACSVVFSSLSTSSFTTDNSQACSTSHNIDLKARRIVNAPTTMCTVYLRTGMRKACLLTAVYQRMLHELLGSLRCRTAPIYLDEADVYSKTRSEHDGSAMTCSGFIEI